MVDDNKKNIYYFESPSMFGLYESLDNWQSENKKRFLSLSIHCDSGKYCCIGVINPSEVVIVGRDGSGDGKYYNVEVNYSSKGLKVHPT